MARQGSNRYTGSPQLSFNRLLADAPGYVGNVRRHPLGDKKQEGKRRGEKSQMILYKVRP
jgi:hypothetical protein